MKRCAKMLDENLEDEVRFKTIREICWHWCPGHSESWNHPKGSRCVLREKAWCPPCLKVTYELDGQ